jgi:thymidylate synthase
MNLSKGYTIDKQYQDLLRTILEEGKDKKDRTGTGTRSIFGHTIRWDMSQGFPLLTTKRMPIKTIATELKWFLRGDTNIKFLHDNNCHIWDGDAYKNYLNIYYYNLKDDKTIQPLSIEEFIEDFKEEEEFEVWGDLGPIYGKQWRDWNGKDQIKTLINELQINPDSRRLMVNAWNVSDLHKMALPPCHYGFQMYTKELSFHERWSLYSDKPYDGNGLGMINALDFMDDEEIPTRSISLMWNQRSVDTFLGLPFNIASYALLLKLIAHEVNMVPDQLIGNLGDVHLYKNHIEQAKEQLKRDPIMLPELNVVASDILNGEFAYELTGYESHKSIKAPLSN